MPEVIVGGSGSKGTPFLLQVKPEFSKATSADATTRGFKTNEFKMVGNFIADVLDHFDNNISNSEQEKIISDKVKILCDKFPIY